MDHVITCVVVVVVVVVDVVVDVVVVVVDEMFVTEGKLPITLPWRSGNSFVYQIIGPQTTFVVVILVIKVKRNPCLTV